MRARRSGSATWSAARSHAAAPRACSGGRRTRSCSASGWSELDGPGCDSAPGQRPTAGWSLTTAELRVLQFLPTHLSFPEIAERLNVSANTVKTHSRAVYRKLDASSRAEAVVHAGEAGLIDDATPVAGRSRLTRSSAQPWSIRRQPESTPCTAAAPMSGSLGKRQALGVEDEGPRLVAAEAAVEGDQLLERAALVEVGVVEAADHDVGDVREAVGAQQVARRVRRERSERVLALDPAVGKVVGARSRRARPGRARLSGRAASRRAGARAAQGSASGGARRSPRA